MISYVMVGTNDLPKATLFFAPLMDILGAEKVHEGDRFVGWGWGIGTPMFIVCLPYDTHPTSVGNGCMLSFDAGSKEKVDQLHTKALELGGTSEGDPGLRGEKLYVAYFRDLDGNKFNCICYL